MTSAPRIATTTGRTAVQWVSLVFGIGFLLVAVLGFAASGMSMEADPNLAPKIFGMFPVNFLHNCVHLAFGVWGLAAWRTYDASRTYCRIAGVIYLVLTAVGYLAPTGFGLVPLGGADVLLHLVLGVVLTGAGFMAKETRAVA
ncbi:MAG: DUF4383 domain-containing protein [Gemmatimonadota bacterium]|nr:DUF4383 domain-containing protein [Gemmatimonadota bacterium]